MLDWTEDQIWTRIRSSGLPPHPCYGYGVSRASCFMCIFARKRELTIAMRRHPERFKAFVDVERELGHRFRMNLSLEDLWNEVRPEDPAAETPSRSIIRPTEGTLPLSA